mmetsp:Transcript_38081/g.82794  ORF Transcript_38081/g.82794 Transcript_38081/m.82794 type:complete len:707 (-) Transcript_38081:254-2374(-)|eukprot:CAMPEP_0118956656 /NCGR_PEP_ID=MMETSP1169-20130426/61695_1 /TAXON_ID=36882 /ORGANISM="Pyramimonas obovata, Strain CCMP722" /LENGTH=706 /DNA_ID=CAMNT_0006904699 /DNA_START=114 /DNA_END=2234 /DNA_ORIENTATION=+
MDLFTSEAVIKQLQTKLKEEQEKVKGYEDQFTNVEGRIAAQEKSYVKLVKEKKSLVALFGLKEDDDLYTKVAEQYREMVAVVEDQDEMIKKLKRAKEEEIDELQRTQELTISDLRISAEETLKVSMHSGKFLMAKERELAEFKDTTETELRELKEAQHLEVQMLRDVADKDLRELKQMHEAEFQKQEEKLATLLREQYRDIAKKEETWAVEKERMEGNIRRQVEEELSQKYAAMLQSAVAECEQRMAAAHEKDKSTQAGQLANVMMRFEADTAKQRAEDKAAMRKEQEAEIAALKAEHTNDLQRLMVEYNALEKATAGKMAEYERRLEEEKKEKEELHAVHKSGEQTLGEQLLQSFQKCTETKEELAEKRRELKAALERVAENKAIIDASMKAHSDMSHQLEEVTKELNAVRAGYTETKTDLEKCHRDREELQVEKLSLNETLDVMKDAVQTIETELKICQKDLVRENEEHTEARTEIADLKMHLVQKDDDMAAFKEQMKHVEKLENNIAELNEAVTGYKEFFTAQETLMKEEEAERERLKTALNAMKEEIEKCAERLKTEKANHHECQKDLATMDKHAQSLEGQMAHAKAYFRTMTEDVKNLEVKVRAYEERMVCLEKEKEEDRDARMKLATALSVAEANLQVLKREKQESELSQMTRQQAIDSAAAELDTMIGQYKSPATLAIAPAGEADSGKTETKIPDFLLS